MCVCHLCKRALPSQGHGISGWEPGWPLVLDLKIQPITEQLHGHGFTREEPRQGTHTKPKALPNAFASVSDGNKKGCGVTETEWTWFMNTPSQTKRRKILNKMSDLEMQIDNTFMHFKRDTQRSFSKRSKRSFWFVPHVFHLFSNSLPKVPRKANCLAHNAGSSGAFNVTDGGGGEQKRSPGCRPAWGHQKP